VFPLLSRPPTNQHDEIAGAVFHVKPSRVISESISGGVLAGERTGLAKLLDKLEAGDVLVVTPACCLGETHGPREPDDRCVTQDPAQRPVIWSQQWRLPASYQVPPTIRMSRSAPSSSAVSAAW